MGDLFKITAHVFVETGDDPEGVAAEFDRGLMAAVEGFPAADVVAAKVDVIEVATDEEKSEYAE